MYYVAVEGTFLFSPKIPDVDSPMCDCWGEPTTITRGLTNSWARTYVVVVVVVIVVYLTPLRPSFGRTSL